MKKRYFVLLPLLLTTFSSCTPSSNPPIIDPEIITPTEIILSDEILNLYVGETYKLTAEILPSDADDKTVTWSTSSDVISVNNEGLISANKVGTGLVYATTSNNLSAYCTITVNEEIGPNPVETKTKEFLIKDTVSSPKSNITDLTTKSYVIEEIFTFTFSDNGGTNKPGYYYTSSGAHGTYRLYPKNSLKITSSYSIKEITFTYLEDKTNRSLDFNSNNGTFSNDKWEGNSKDITFTVGDGTSGSYAIEKLTIVYEEGTISHEAINLGEKSIKEVKQYISSADIELNSAGIGVDQYTTATIKGLATAKIDLIKSTTSFGLNVSYPAKVIISDATDSIAVATKTGEGTIWKKIDNYVNKETSCYKVTGYISKYLGHPELVITSFSYEPTLKIKFNKDVQSTKDISLNEFYEDAKNVNYNCAGHGYGDIVTVKNVKCYHSESDGQGKRYYSFTDGTRSISVNAFNMPSVSINTNYDITGIISLKNYSPIIVAMDIKRSMDADFEFDYENASTAITIENLRNIRGSQDDTNTRYPDLINAFGTFYKTEGYLSLVNEGGKYYVAISDTYYESPLTGKEDSKTNKGVALIKNDNFWNVYADRLELFNPYFNDYILENIKVILYYIPKAISYKNNKAGWEVMLIDESIPVLEK